jgi:hypothetical protein
VCVCVAPSWAIFGSRQLARNQPKHAVCLFAKGRARPPTTPVPLYLCVRVSACVAPRVHSSAPPRVAALSVHERPLFAASCILAPAGRLLLCALRARPASSFLSAARLRVITGAAVPPVGHAWSSRSWLAVALFCCVCVCVCVCARESRAAPFQPRYIVQLRWQAFGSGAPCAARVRVRVRARAHV